MFRDLKYYKELSEQLGKEIEICESSYENFEKAVDLTKKYSELTEEQKKIGSEFASFCKEEGFSKDGRVKEATYPKIKEAIIERVNFLKEQKSINDGMVSLYEELDKLKNKGEISESDINELKKRAETRYDVGTEKYNQELSRIKKEFIDKKVEKINDSITATKETVKKSKKENGLAKVISSAFGPAGNAIYNTYAKIHNKNVDLRKNRVLNLVVKAGLSIGFLGLVSVAGLTGLPLVIGIGAGLTMLYKSVANTFKKVPAKLELKEKVSSFKESLFRFKKTHTKGSMSTSEELYKNVDFSKYTSLKASEPAVVEEPVKDEESVKDEELAKEPVKTETPDALAPVVETEKISDTEKSTEEPTVVESSVETPVEPIVEKNVDETEETVKTEMPVEIENPVKRSEPKVKKVKDIIPEKNSGTEVSSIYDIMQVFKKFREQDGIKTMDDWYTYKNIRNYLGKVIFETGDSKYIELRNLFDEMAKNITPELRMHIQTVKTFEQVDVSNKRKSMSTLMKDATNLHRQKEYERIINLIETAETDEVVMSEVNSFLDHYGKGVTEAQQKYIRELLKERESRISESLGRGK